MNLKRKITTFLITKWLKPRVYVDCNDKDSVMVFIAFENWLDLQQHYYELLPATKVTDFIFIKKR